MSNTDFKKTRSRCQTIQQDAPLIKQAVSDCSSAAPCALGPDTMGSSTPPSPALPKHGPSAVRTPTSTRSAGCYSFHFQERSTRWVCSWQPVGWARWVLLRRRYQTQPHGNSALVATIIIDCMPRQMAQSQPIAHNCNGSSFACHERPMDIIEWYTLRSVSSCPKQGSHPHLAEGSCAGDKGAEHT